MAGERSNRDESRQKAGEVFGIDTSRPTEFEVGLEEARRVIERGPGAVAVAASGMSEESLEELRTAFEE